MKEESQMEKAIYFDLDGTLAGMYNVANWLQNLIDEKTKPYREAKPLVNMRELGRELNRLQKLGYHIGVISWLSKNSSPSYDARVTATKLNWLKRHISAVTFNEINIVSYGTPKQKSVRFPGGILFDDEKQNRDNWNGIAYDVGNILEVLKNLN